MNRSPFWFPTALALAIFLVGGLASAQKTKILYLGDSLSMGAFGQTLDAGLRSQGAEVYTVIAGGASPYYWLKSYQALPCTIGFWEKSPTSERRVPYVRTVPKLEDLIETHRPHFVVVQTGINLYATLRSQRRPKEENVIEIRSLIEQMCHSISKSGAHAYWILPPHSHERRYHISLQNELAGIMRNVVKEYRGAVFESSQVTRYTDPYPAKDGIHFGNEEATEWALKVGADLSVFVQERRPAQPSQSVYLTNANEQAPRPPKARLILDPSSSFATESATSIPSSRQSVNSAAPDQPNVPPKPLPALPQANAGKTLVFDRLDLDLRLVAKSEIPILSQIDYANALGVYEYEVLRDRMGNYPYGRIRVAHGIVFRRKLTGAAKREVGSTIALRLVPLNSYQNLKTWQRVDDLPPNFEMPLYTPKLD